MAREKFVGQNTVGASNVMPQFSSSLTAAPSSSSAPTQWLVINVFNYTRTYGSANFTASGRVGQVGVNAGLMYKKNEFPGTPISYKGGVRLLEAGQYRVDCSVTVSNTITDTSGPRTVGIGITNDLIQFTPTSVDTSEVRFPPQTQSDEDTSASFRNAYATLGSGASGECVNLSLSTIGNYDASSALVMYTLASYLGETDFSREFEGNLFGRVEFTKLDTDNIQVLPANDADY